MRLNVAVGVASYPPWLKPADDVPATRQQLWEDMLEIAFGVAEALQPETERIPASYNGMLHDYHSYALVKYGSYALPECPFDLDSAGIPARSCEAPSRFCEPYQQREGTLDLELRLSEFRSDIGYPADGAADTFMCGPGHNYCAMQASYKNTLPFSVLPSDDESHVCLPPFVPYVHSNPAWSAPLEVPPLLAENCALKCVASALRWDMQHAEDTTGMSAAEIASIDLDVVARALNTTAAELERAPEAERPRVAVIVIPPIYSPHTDNFWPRGWQQAMEKLKGVVSETGGAIVLLAQYSALDANSLWVHDRLSNLVDYMDSEYPNAPGFVHTQAYDDDGSAMWAGFSEGLNNVSHLVRQNIANHVCVGVPFPSPPPPSPSPPPPPSPPPSADLQVGDDDIFLEIAQNLTTETDLTCEDLVQVIEGLWNASMQLADAGVDLSDEEYERLNETLNFVYEVHDSICFLPPVVMWWPWLLLAILLCTLPLVAFYVWRSRQLRDETKDAALEAVRRRTRLQTISEWLNRNRGWTRKSSSGASAKTHLTASTLYLDNPLLALSSNNLMSESEHGLLTAEMDFNDDVESRKSTALNASHHTSLAISTENPLFGLKNTRVERVGTATKPVLAMTGMGLGAAAGNQDGWRPKTAAELDAIMNKKAEQTVVPLTSGLAGFAVAQRARKEKRIGVHEDVKNTSLARAARRWKLAHYAVQEALRAERVERGTAKMDLFASLRAFISMSQMEYTAQDLRIKGSVEELKKRVRRNLADDIARVLDETAATKAAAEDPS